MLLVQQQKKGKRIFRPMAPDRALQPRVQPLLPGGRAHGELDLPGIREVAGEVSDMVEKLGGDVRHLIFAQFQRNGGRAPPAARYLRDPRRAQGAGLRGLPAHERHAHRRGKGRAGSSGLVDGVQISIEGPEAVHDAIRGKGAFLRGEGGRKSSSPSGVPISLNTTLSSLNVAYLDDILSMGLDLGVRRVGFSRLVPYGRGRGSRDEMLTPRAGPGGLRARPAFKDGRIEVATGDPIAASMEATRRTRGISPSRVARPGVSGLTLLPDGTLMPCRRLPVAIGNVQTDSMREVWTQSPVLDLLRERAGIHRQVRRCSRWAAVQGMPRHRLRLLRIVGEGGFPR